MSRSDLDLKLEWTGQEDWGHQFSLKLTNVGKRRLFIPEIQVLGLRIAPIESLEPLGWYTHMLVSRTSPGLVIEPQAHLNHLLRVRPSPDAAGCPHPDWDYDRWYVSLFTGEYQAWYEFSVDETYFHGDSHVRFQHLERMAADEGASVWVGSTVSNTVGLYHVDRQTDSGSRRA